MSNYTCISNTPVELYLYLSCTGLIIPDLPCTCRIIPVSPVHMSNYTCISNTSVELYLYLPCTCRNIPVSLVHRSHYTSSPVHMSNYTCISRAHVALYLNLTCTGRIVPVSTVYISGSICTCCVYIQTQLNESIYISDLINCLYFSVWNLFGLDLYTSTSVSGRLNFYEFHKMRKIAFVA